MVSVRQKRQSPIQGITRSNSTVTLTISKKGTSTPTISPIVSEKMASSDPDLAKQLFKANVKIAIEDRVSGSGAKYEELRLKFASLQTPPIELCQYIIALNHFVTRLEAPTYTSLIRAIVSRNWITFPSAIIPVYIQFLGALVTAQPTHLSMMLSSLLSQFSDVTISENAGRTDIQLNAHWAMQHLLEVVPSGYSILIRLIRENFPHPTAERREQISYVFNLMRISQYAEHLRGELLSLCVERVVNLDVEIQLELDRLEDDLEEELLLNQFDGQPYSAEEDINTEPATTDGETETSSGFLDPTSSLTTLRDTITTLDALMTTLFEYLLPFFPTTSSSPTLDAEHLFDSLLSTFVTRILPTYHCRHAQFFIFKTSQTNSLFLDKFLGILIERSLDPSLPIITRKASAAYLASFVARAKSLTSDTIRTVVEMLCVFLSRVLDEMPSGRFVPGGVAGNHGLGGVYAVFQAVIYIYCFRWRELRDEDEESGEMVWMPQLNVISRIAWSGLNPLAHVSQDVAQEFAHRSYELQHIFVHSILRENARKGLVAGFLQHNTRRERDQTEDVVAEVAEIQSSESRDRSDDREEQNLPRDWYPFDPYALPRSKKFVEDCFVEYMPSDEEDEEMASDEEESGSEDEMSEDDD